MKQLICPDCSSVLPHPQSKSEQTIACYLCGKSFRLSRRSTSDAGVPAANAATLSAPRAASVLAPRVSVAVGQPVKAQQAAPALPLRQAPLLPAPSPRRHRRWIVAVFLLLLIAAFSGGSVLLVHSRMDKNAAASENSTEANASLAGVSGNEQVTPPMRDPADEEAEPVEEPQMREIVRINACGDGSFVRTYRVPRGTYTKLKGLFADSNVVRRQFGFRQHWQQIEDFGVEFHDTASAMTLRWRVRGLARATSHALWTAALIQEAGLNLISSTGNEAILTGKLDMELGPQRLVTRIVRAPEGSHDVQLLADRRIGYRLAAAPGSRAGEAGLPRFVLQTKPHLLACLGQVYAQPKFTRFWTARCLFKNTSGQTLRDYSVRFRLAEYTADFKEFACPLVVPGQTIVDVYFPLLDFKKLVELTDAKRIPLEVEYQYRQPDGRLIQKKEIQPVQLLSRNQVLFSSLTDAELLDRNDCTDNMPFILAALVSKDDKVIEEMAGRVARRQGGTNADENHPNEVLKFMEGVYNFMSAYLSYQIPATDIFDGSHSQTIMYGRDVLNKKAGTCIDLAILYASACLAQDLKSQLILVPHHCFPVIRLKRPISIKLPDGNGRTIEFQNIHCLGVETTMIGKAGFAVACCRGTMNYYDHCNKGTIDKLVDIYTEHAKGVRSLPFPVQSLKDLGISDDDERWAARTTGPARGGQAPSRGGSGGGFVPPPTREAERPVATPVGQWFANGRLPDGMAYEYTLTLGKDGSYKLLKKLVKMSPRGEAAPPVEQEIAGTYKIAQESIVFTSANNEKQVCEYSLRGTRLFISMPHLQYGRVFFNFLKLPD